MILISWYKTDEPFTLSRLLKPKGGKTTANNVKITITESVSVGLSVVKWSITTDVVEYACRDENEL